MIFLLLILAILVIFLLSVTLILLIVGPVLLLKPHRRSAGFYRQLGRPSSPEEAGLRYEEIIIRTAEGLRLDSWLVKSSGPPLGTVIYLHGVADCKIDGIRMARWLRDSRYNVFLYDSRRHGESDGEYCTYGYFEKKDVIAVIDYLAGRPDLGGTPIAMFGTSMGAAVAIQAAAIDTRIRAVIAENSFATLRSIFDDYQKRMIKLPFHYLRNLVIKRSELVAGFEANAVSPLEAVRKIDIPLMIIVAEQDHLIRAEYSHSLFAAANEPREMFSIQGAAHSDTWEVAGGLYEKRILDFLRRSLE
ncbi:MAG TPA: alpha/beta hydrolase [Bacteroidota bacterium]|nr:alpha/beta hydrolase [Bacteroidota bacterium]